MRIMVGKQMEDDENIDQNAINFVDNSGSVIVFQDGDKVQEYAQTFIELDFQKQQNYNRRQRCHPYI